MSEYHKIQTLYLRDPATGHRALLHGEWALPEFAYLKDVEWVFTEKVDGTNIRVVWDGAVVGFGGKTDNAQIPTPLLGTLLTTFTADKLAAALKGPLVLYGEGYGPKIQSGGRYADEASFILFDACADGVWLNRDTLEEIAAALGVALVPIIGRGTPLDAITMARAGFLSVVAKDPTLIAEGIVLRPAVELLDRRGRRIIGKIKHKDFQGGAR